jgi:flagellar motor protein MotB
MYNSKHPLRWYESLPYVQHSYNRSLHSSTSHNPFQVGLGFQPLGPIDVALPLAVTPTNSSPAPTKAEKATSFIDQVQHIFQQVQDILQNSNDKYKQRHYQQRTMKDEEWEVLDRKELRTIRLILIASVTFNISKEKTTKELMDALAKLYEKTSTCNKVFLMK